jgi:TonB family protein
MNPTQPYSTSSINASASTGIPFNIAENKKSSLNFSTMIGASILLHFLLVALLLIGSFILQLLGFNIPLFEPLALKKKDIEFVLVENPPAPPRDKNTRNRADKMSRSGGTKVKNKPMVEPQRAAGAPSPQRRASSPAAKPTPRVAPSPKPAPQPTPVRRPTPVQQAPRPVAQPSKAPEPQPQQPPAPPAPKVPTPRKLTQASPALPPNPIPPAIATPKPPTPKALAMGPIVRTPGVISGSQGGRATGGGGGSPGPSQIPGSVSGSGHSGSSGGWSPGGGGSPGGMSSAGSGGSGAYNQAGSPGGGGGRPGIDAMPEPDFGPYISELQRRIKRNWVPPADNRNKRIVALFTIARDGRLVGLRVQNSSGVQIADEAAMMAVRASAPFRPLPPNYKGKDIDVQFIFDYNVYTGRSKGISYSQ